GGVKGRGGLKLSLDGYHPEEDYKWIVKGGTYQVLSPEPLPPLNPRVNVQDPPQSLLLLKPTMIKPHGGGRLIQNGSRDYEVILKWVRQGAPYGEDDFKSVTGIEITPMSSSFSPNRQPSYA